MKSHKFFWLSSLIIIIVMIVTSFIFIQRLPQQIAIQWNYSGVSNFAGKYIIFLFPLLAITIFLLQFFQFNKYENQIKYGFLNFILNLILYMVELIICLNAIKYISIKNINFRLVETFIITFFGILFMYYGNKIPKSPQNFYISIRKPISCNDINWAKIQKTTGKVWFIGGLFIFLCGIISYFTKSTIINIFIFLALLIMVFIPRIYAKDILQHKTKK